MYAWYTSLLDFSGREGKLHVTMCSHIHIIQWKFVPQSETMLKNIKTVSHNNINVWTSGTRETVTGNAILLIYIQYYQEVFFPPVVS